MKALSFDPGAERMGWACVEQEDDKSKPPVYHASGIYGVARRDNGSEPFQEYRLRLIEFWTKQGPRLLQIEKPDLVVSEVVPPVGGSPGNQMQRYLANVGISVVQAMAYQQGLSVAQISANTVKKQIGGKGKATKVRVRNGVIELLPILKDRKKQWSTSKAMDEPDAIAIGLAHFGLKAKHGK